MPDTTQEHKVIILLSDVDAVFARVCKNKFGQLEGWEPFITASYNEALSIIDEQKPTLVLTEIILQEGNGFDLLKHIRESADAAVSSIPVIILSDLSQESDKKKAADLGATEYLVKSEISLSEVISQLQSIIAN